MQFDVIVVGAGPAGATAAARCAEAGMRVALVEKQTLPRHKTCGGGMPMMVGDHLRGLAPEAFIESDVTRMRHTWRFCDPVVGEVNPAGSTSRISLWMVQRSIFDNALAQRAASLGACLYDGLPVRSIDASDTGVRVEAGQLNGPTFAATAGFLIGADGANGVSARAAGLRKNRLLAIALEVEHPFKWEDAVHPEVRPDTCHLEYGAIPRGYAWVFPKRDHLNVGAGVFRPRQTGGRGDSSVRPMLQRAIHGYLDSLSIPFEPGKLVFHAHPLPIWNGAEPLHAFGGRIMLAGDAAGLINPFFGDGILHAIKSGELAAQAILDGRAGDYSTRLHAGFADNFDSALKLAKFFYQWPGLCYRHGVRREQATRTAARLLCGETLFSNIAARVLRNLTSAGWQERAADPSESA